MIELLSSSLLYEIPRNPAIAVGLPIALGGLSGAITKSSVNTWYAALAKPPGQPPRIAFPIVWTLLYGAMGYAAHLTASHVNTPFIGDAARDSLHLQYAQFGMNMLWTPLFFGAKKPVLALLDITALLGTVLKTTNDLRGIDTNAFYLYLPYCAWLGYATYLNAGIIYKNYKNKN
ncbi:hypothetical protein E3P86_03352 [Wallemia ichthyophaga]|uniref:Translocator protein-like protein n=1 Tax=Wallemia ichthyophaga TaxID=245174 RepID=A0A4T0ISC6_WALIC|nr:hypothetical protein E3P86_03352 [Wallemia ichthyophaga]